ncbi:MAG: SsrA-binding protein SmpB [Muribaculaceae bacterium]|nr:SsrA-binding protein SmpB [Muribaculaceae bacterium]
MKMNAKDISIKNRRATYDYAIVETFTAGIVLTGTEIKSLRQGKGSLVDTFCYVDNGEVWVKNMYIAEYFYGTYNNHAARRDRKLLLQRKEIRRLEKDGKESGFTIVPLKLFISERGLAKLVIGLARGKKEYDKRQSIREREDKRAIARMFQK